MQHLASAVVRDIASAIAEDGIWVAAVTFSNKASVLFNFDDHADDPLMIATALDALAPDQATPTLAHTAFETLLSKVLVVGSSNGFRHFVAPVIVVALTDGEILVPEESPVRLNQSLFAAGLARQEVSRLAIGVGEWANVPVLRQLAGTCGAAVDLGCSGPAAERALVALVRDRLDPVVRLNTPKRVLPPHRQPHRQPHAPLRHRLPPP
jgi:Mg-chelatase subunit ChlD